MRSRYATLETHIRKNADTGSSRTDDMFVVSKAPARDHRLESGMTSQPVRKSDSLYTPVSSGGFSDNSYATRARTSSRTPQFSSFTSTSSTRSTTHTRVEAQRRDMWGNAGDPAFLDELERKRNGSSRGQSGKRSSSSSSSRRRNSTGSGSRNGSSRRSGSTSSSARSASRERTSQRNRADRSTSYSRHEYARERRANNLVPALALPRLRVADRISVRTARIIAIVVIVAALALMIYPAARELFISKRDYERANIELTEVNDRNQQIQDDINTIKTDEGVESYVREQFGWVKEGETAVTVTGVPTTTESESLLMPEDVNSTEVEATSSVYSGILSKLFLAGD